jgi:hypothetical protein
MSRIPAWLYILFGVIAIVAGVLGVIYAPSGAPKIYNGILTLVGVASVVGARVFGRRTAVL